MLKKAIFILSFLTVVALQAQQNYSITLLGSYTVPNSSEWDYIRGFGYGVDASMWVPQRWFSSDSSYLIRIPYNAGVRINYTRFPDGIAGDRFGILGFIQEPILSIPHLYLDMGVLAAIYTNPFRRSHDNRNVFIGSYLNCLIQVGLTYKIKALTFSGKFAHSSNGYLYKPNKGLNYLQFEVGHDFRSNNAHTQNQLSFTPTSLKTSSLLISIAPGIVRPRLTEVADRYYYAYTIRLGWQYNFSQVRAAGITLDVTNNGSHDSIRVAEHDPYKLPFNVALCANYETWYNHISLHLGIAYYLLRNAQVYSPYYERIGAFYHFGDDKCKIRHFVGVSLKSHAAHIDFIEWHYGIRIRL